MIYLSVPGLGGYATPYVICGFFILYKIGALLSISVTSKLFITYQLCCQCDLLISYLGSCGYISG